MTEPTIEELRKQLEEAQAKVARLTKALQRAEWLQNAEPGTSTP
jgi:5-bromo-4-chloroindolyl phosphate hydrolysis protein